MPERKFSDESSYRYGFNGKENDREVVQYDYGFRIYDPRLGRFKSVDPIAKKYPDLTPYQFASNRPIDGIDQDGLEFMKYDKTYKTTIIIPKSRDGFIEAQYKYAMQAKMNVLVAGTLKEANQYMQEKGTKYDAILFGGHGGYNSSAISMGDYGYRANDMETNKSELKNLGGYIKKDGTITLLACFQSTPQYEEKNLPTSDGGTIDIKVNGEELVKKLSSITNRKVVANRATTRISYKMFDGTLPQTLTEPQDAEHPYGNMNNKYAGQWTLTMPDGTNKVIGTITLNPDGSYKTTPTNSQHNNDTSTNTSNGNTNQKKKASPPPPSSGG